jgi:3-hydroxyisobutyrate dehydrogenase-like beta-hydroxyacid dehydrogenase
VLSRRYGAGFTVGLMERDLGTALAVASAGGTETPFLQGTLRVWQQVVRVLGRNRDFTMVHAVVTTLSQAKVISSAQCSVELLARACAAMNLIAAREAVRVARGEDLDVQRFLAIVNASSGGSEATRSDLRGDTDVDALVQARGLARRAQVWAPLTTLAAEL